MNKRLTKTKAYGHAAISLALLSCFSFGSASLAQTAPPPNIGEDTKGEPAIIEQPADVATNPSKDQSTAKNKAANTTNNGPLGSATIKESRRENGQVYRIELKHSSGAKQIIEENDSDGSIESTSNDIDDTPNLPKWKLGSW